MGDEAHTAWSCAEAVGSRTCLITAEAPFRACWVHDVIGQTALCGGGARASSRYIVPVGYYWGEGEWGDSMASPSPEVPSSRRAEGKGTGRRRTLIDKKSGVGINSFSVTISRSNDSLVPCLGRDPLFSERQQTQHEHR